jgi:formamidopyrimidine-DNA glycosylase
VPEGIEIELYRRAAEPALGRTIETVDAPDGLFLKRGLTAPVLTDALVGRQLVAARRRGKLLLLDTSDGGPVLGLRFGMTGRLVVDGRQGIDELEYGSARDLATWDRFTLGFAGGGQLRLNDPRRLGGIELDPDEAMLGVDAFTIRPRELAAALDTSTAPLKARLMDQGRIAGIGNLLADEILWRAGLDPARRAGSLDGAERGRLLRALRAVLAELLAAGGSHLGRLQAARQRGGVCPRDGTPLERRTIGGRTTYSCPRHQR